MDSGPAPRGASRNDRYIVEYPPSPRPRQPERAFHHLHRAAADMGGDNRTVLLADPRQQQARPAHVDALPDAQLQLAVAFTGEVGEQRRRGHGGAAGGGVLNEAARTRKKQPRLPIGLVLGG